VILHSFVPHASLGDDYCGYIPDSTLPDEPCGWPRREHTTRPLPVDTGCWIDNRWGQYGVARLVEIARNFGYDDALIIDLAERKLAAMLPSNLPQLSDENEELLNSAADEVEVWLDDNVAPEGYSFGWYEGEFFLQSEAWWAE